MRTTNLLERFHKEIRRKQRDIGMLQSTAGGDVLWYMVAIQGILSLRTPASQIQPALWHACGLDVISPWICAKRIEATAQEPSHP